MGTLAVLNEPALFGADGKVVLQRGNIGAVAHEVESMRISDNHTFLVDMDLKVEGFDNLFVCDNSAFPVSPCGNPSLTLVALAKRLAAHLAQT